MSQIYSSSTSVSPAPSGAVEGVKTNTQGVVVKPDGTGNINVVGGPGVNVEGAGSTVTVHTTGDRTSVGQIDVDKGGSIQPNTSGVVDVKGGTGIEVRKTGDNAIEIAETGGGRDVSSLGTPQGEVYPNAEGKIKLQPEGRTVIKGDAATNTVIIDVPASGDSFLSDTTPNPVLPDAQGRVRLKGGKNIQTQGNPSSNDVTFNYTGNPVQIIGCEEGTDAKPDVIGQISFLAGRAMRILGTGNASTVTFICNAIDRIVTTVGTITPSEGGVIITAGEGIVLGISAQANELVISAPNRPSFRWQAVTSGRILSKNFGFILTSATDQNFPLPQTAAVGDLFELAQYGAGRVKITQGANQSIRFGNQTSTTGLNGSWESRLPGSAIKLVCVVENTSFMAVTGAIGNWDRT